MSVTLKSRGIDLQKLDVPIDERLGSLGNLQSCRTYIA